MRERKLKQLDSFLLNQVETETPDVETITSRVQSFLVQVRKIPKPEEETLTAILIRDHLQQLIRPEQLVEIRKLIAGCSQSKTLRLYFSALDTIRQAVNHYIIQDSGSPGYWQFEPLPNPLANKLLDLEAGNLIREKADQFGQGSKHSYSFEILTDPKTSVVTIWMSTTGRPRI